MRSLLFLPLLMLVIACSSDGTAESESVDTNTVDQPTATESTPDASKSVSSDPDKSLSEDVDAIYGRWENNEGGEICEFYNDGFVYFGMQNMNGNEPNLLSSPKKARYEYNPETKKIKFEFPNEGKKDIGF
ncbi:MAG: hypothetical protein IH946_09400, partial [Bacteroidetes bacterium]|nr:hypothetical protein [Bacteroidota bacterium]